MSLEAMKMALEALEWNYGTDLENIENCTKWLDYLNKTIPALRQAIEQAEKQEPYGYLWFTHHMERRFTHYKPKEEQRIGDVRPVYTAPVDAVNISQERVDETAKREHEPWPSVKCTCGGTIYFKHTKREWVGLTDEEMTSLRQKSVMDGMTRIVSDFEYIRAIEAKLKERNGG